MVSRLAIFSVAASACLSSGCQKSGTISNAERYEREILEWRKERLTRLTGDDGWLTLIGLFWLKNGENTIGSDLSNTLILPPGKAPHVAGSFWLEKDRLRFVAKLGSGIKHNDLAVTSLVLQSDEHLRPTILRLGTVSFYVIKRGSRYAVRVTDTESPSRREFGELEYFPIDPAWRFEATFEPYVPPKTLEIASQVGTVEQYLCPGALAFDLDGKRYRLDAVVENGSEDELFIMMSDETSGSETYAVGRQLYTGRPDSKNHVLLDFNKAYNWPCVFTNFATCPIPPSQNHLPIRVEAGEKMYRGHR